MAFSGSKNDGPPDITDKSKDSALTLLILSALAGVITGILCSILRIAIDYIVLIRELWLMGAGPSLLNSDLSKGAVVVFSSTALSFLSVYLVFRLAPEAKGSGIPEVEGAIEDVRHVRWWRVIPVKLFGAIGAIGSGMMLGRGGPSVQIGANTGQMIFELFRLKEKDSEHTLMVCGTAAGLAAAFNAPLAGIMFVVAEEMLPKFHYTFVSFKAVIIATVTATFAYQILQDNQPLFEMTTYAPAPLSAIPLFIIIGLACGITGVIFNRMVIITRQVLILFHSYEPLPYLVLFILLGVFFGLMLLIFPDLASDGSALILNISHQQLVPHVLILLFIARFIATLLCFGSGAPGGMMMPALALGSLLGGALGSTMLEVFPRITLDAHQCCLAGMVALFAATVRAPIAAILLVMETTSNYNQILPLLISSLSAVIIAQAMGGRPIDSWLLQQSLTLEQAIRDKQKNKIRS